MKPSTWAVKKEGRVRAIRVFDNEADAEKRCAEEGKGAFVEYRPGAYTRCEGFCAVQQWCPEYQNGA